MTADRIKSELIDFLQSEAAAISLEDVGEFDRAAAQAKLRELIPATIEVKQVCRCSKSIVIAAPHARFDGWTQFFSRIAATEFAAGRVVAYNFRDENEYDIPVSIGRHIHVNRPTESAMPYGEERVTERAREAFDQYLRAISQAGAQALPIDLLIEFHGQRRNESIEIATLGVERELAEKLLDVYQENQAVDANLPEFRIEPLHQLHFSAERAKQDGVMRPEVARQALHIELPRTLRRPEPNRIRAWNLLQPVLCFLVRQYIGAEI
ncbi:hypothetical protein KKG66_04275 [bacterium]|nr:hypothetical protein [bacterium]